MSAEKTLCESLSKFVFANGVSLHDIRVSMTFIWCLVGLLLSGKIQLSQWALHRPGKAGAHGKERQISRWLHNEQIVPKQVYRNLITAALLQWNELRVEIALDTSGLWNRFVIVRVSVIYRGRAIPLAWKVLERKSVSVSFSDYADLLWAVRQMLPFSCKVLLLADRGFVDTELLFFARQFQWDYILRAKSSLWVHRKGHASVKLGQLLPPQGQIHLIPAAKVTAKHFGPLALAIAHVRTQGGYQRWFLLTNTAPSLATFEDYALRFDIEENFLDDKSAGFQLESSEIEDAAALARLCLILATATLYLVSTGTAIHAMNLRPLVDTHWQRGLSYFQLGWRWIRFALANAARLLFFLWLEPGPDPEPVFASRAQANRSPFAFSEIRFLD
jgi:hypothetical protein